MHDADATIVEEHVKNMQVHESFGRHILDAKAVVEEYLKRLPGSVRQRRD